jgi:hypothetical protein
MNNILNIIKGTAAIIDEKAADVKMELEKKAAEFIGTAAATGAVASSAVDTGSNKMKNMERYVMCQRCHLRRRARMH